MNHQLEAVRAEIDLMSAELKSIECAPLPMPTVLEKVRMVLNQHRQYFDDKINHIALQVATTTKGGPLISTTEELLFGWLISVHGDAMLAEIEARANKFRKAEGLKAMPQDERLRRLDVARRALYELWLKEEEIVEATGAERRPDACTAAVMGVPFDIALAIGVAS